MFGSITMIVLIITEMVFLYGLWWAPERRRWTDPVAMIGMAIAAIGLIMSFQDSGIHMGWTIALVTALIVLVVATELQYKKMGPDGKDTLVTIHLFVAVVVMVTFWAAVKELQGVSENVIAMTALAFGAYELLTVVFLNLTGRGQELREKKAIVMTILIVSVAVLILGLGSMIEAVGAF